MFMSVLSGLALSALVVVAACAPVDETLPHVTGPDGRRWWELTCDSKKECWEELSAQCPKGYVTADEATEDKGASGAVIGNGVFMKHHTETLLLFRCKNDR